MELHDSEQALDMMADRASSILVIDDHPLYGDALADALRRIAGAERVETVSTLNGALELLASGFQPDLATFDLTLPDSVGLAGFARLRARAPDTPILVISAESSDELITGALELGAAGFLPKNCGASTLDDALTTIRAGGKFTPPDYSPTRREAAEGPSLQETARLVAELTPQQERIMRLIAEGKPNKLIAYEMSLAEATVKAHVSALLRRLGVTNRTQVALLARGLDGASSGQG